MRTFTLCFAGFLVTVWRSTLRRWRDRSSTWSSWRMGWSPLWIYYSRPQRSPLHRGPTGLVLTLTPKGTVLPTPFLDITDRVVIQSAFDERGLLALVFHPRFARNGKIYVQYSAAQEGPNI
jgi:hypothetical protein